MRFGLLCILPAWVTLAAGIGLVVARALIPDTAGIELARPQYPLAYLLAATEFGLAGLSYVGRELAPGPTRRIPAALARAYRSSDALLVALAARLAIISDMIRRQVRKQHREGTDIAYDETLAPVIRDALKRHYADIGEQRMFDGIAFLRGGLMLAGVSGTSLMRAPSRPDKIYLCVPARASGG